MINELKYLYEYLVLPAGGGDSVPQHEQAVTDVQHPQLAAEGSQEEAGDDEADSEHQDGRVSPL